MTAADLTPGSRVAWPVRDAEVVVEVLGVYPDHITFQHPDGYTDALWASLSGTVDEKLARTGWRIV